MKKKIWSDGVLVLSLSDTQDPVVRELIHEQIKAFNDAISKPHAKRARRAYGRYTSYYGM